LIKISPLPAIIDCGPRCDFRKGSSISRDDALAKQFLRPTKATSHFVLQRFSFSLLQLGKLIYLEAIFKVSVYNWLNVI